MIKLVNIDLAYNGVAIFENFSLEIKAGAKAVKPTLASMATMGIVALPGMMTGVILGGTSPQTAIKYQIMIMIAIVTSTTASVVLTILMTMRVCFTKYGMLKTEIFVGNSSS